MIPDSPSPHGQTQDLPGDRLSTTPLRLERRALQRPGDPFTVLVIDDDAAVRALVRRCLTCEGYAVLEAEDGQSGLELLEGHPGGIDLVLTDIDMPRIDGITVARVLAALRPLVGVICMSGTATQGEPGDRVGAFDPSRFLTKPFTSEHLTHMLDDELARVQELAAAAESSQTVSRTLADEHGLMLAVDVVASGLWLQTRDQGRDRSRVRSPWEAKQA
jgi:CheY-like chemotaxis protein